MLRVCSLEASDAARLAAGMEWERQCCDGVILAVARDEVGCSNAGCHNEGVAVAVTAGEDGCSNSSCCDEGVAIAADDGEPAAATRDSSGGRRWSWLLRGRRHRRAGYSNYDEEQRSEQCLDWRWRGEEEADLIDPTATGSPIVWLRTRLFFSSLHPDDA